MNSTLDQRTALPQGVDLDKETVIIGRVVDDSGRTVGGASVRLLDAANEFTAELVATAGAISGSSPRRAPGRCWRCRGPARVMSRWHPPGRACTRSTSRWRDATGRPWRHRDDPGDIETTWSSRDKLPVVLFFEVLLVVSVVVITWFALYAVYRLITDES